MKYNKAIGKLLPTKPKNNFIQCIRKYYLMAPIDPETIKDMFMYRNYLGWILNALDTHVRAIIETIRNDALRKLWADLLNAELDYYDKYLKYGKMKGWTKLVPIYGEPVL